MERFSYVRAATVPDALALLNQPGLRSRLLCGGTDLLLIARQNPTFCQRVIDISLLPELHAITRSGDCVSIGAAASFTEVLESPIVRETAPVLAQACSEVGAVQVRNMGTIGGNVANAAACADSLPALVCLEAVAHVETREGDCPSTVSELVLSPNRTRIPAGGILTHFTYTVPAPGSRSAFLKLGRRNAMAISRLTVAALGRLDATRRVAEIRLVPGSAAPQISRFTAVEDMLMGREPAGELLAEAGQAAAAEMVRRAGRRWSSEFKEPALAAMVTRALEVVFGNED